MTQRNHLLKALDADSLARIAPHLERVDFERSKCLSAAGETPEHAYFFEDGFASIVAKGPDGRSAEVGLIGREGLSAIAVVLGGESWPHDTFIQHEGAAQRIAAAELQRALDDRRGLRRVMLRYCQAFLTQVSHTALAKSYARLEERAARWLLMAHDRVDGDELFLVHEFLAYMLGVRRASVTVALHALEGRRSIQAERGRITIIDRARLERDAGGFYGEPEREFRRMIN